MNLVTRPLITPSPLTKPSAMRPMPIADFAAVCQSLSDSGRRVHVLWQEPESLAFVARGREYRSEFHINPSDEMMYVIKGTLRLHYRTPEGHEEVAVMPQGTAIHTPAGVPHSPRFPPDGFLFVTERKRLKGEIDRFQWFCPKCDHFLHEEEFVVADYTADPVSKAYRNFFDSEDFRTCKSCGHTMPAPAST
jgi:3-hydroxyanthranilate 3,4-dioxygenase